MSEYVVRRLRPEADLAPVLRMRRDWTTGATPGDAASAGLSRSDTDDPTYEERFRRWWEHEAPSRCTWLAWCGADAVGMSNVKTFERMPRPGVDSSRWAYVANVWVDPPHRRKGVGTALVRQVVEWATEEGMVRLVLSPSVESLRLYRAMGFRPAHDLLRLDLNGEP